MNQNFMLLPQKTNSHEGNRTFRGSFVFYPRNFCFVMSTLIHFAFAACFSQPFEFYPNGTYLAHIPSPEKVLGYPLGSTFSRYEDMREYVHRLAENSDRVRLTHIGTSNERRKLYLLQISSPENLARLEDIRANNRKLADPRLLTENQARMLVKNLPTTVWLNYGIHGDESAAFETAMQIAYQLAAGTDSLTLAILKNVVVLINMCHNPDSHERFVTWYNSVQVGTNGTADPNAAEHHDPWGMNTTGNHYQIDLNRDWFIASQVETQAVLEQYLHWQPQVLVDHHGETHNYFFGPQADPINANIKEPVRRWFKIFAEENARAFDQYGWSYYGREEFDEFYPGYSSAWACLNGAVGMTYETDGGGDRGLQVERWDDGTIVTLRDGIHHHFTASLTTLATAAQQREARLRDFYQFKQSAIAEGHTTSMRRFVFVPGSDPQRSAQFVHALLRQGIEVHEATAAFQLTQVHDYFQRKTSMKNFPAGTYLVEAAQPQKHLLTAILEPEPYLLAADTLASDADQWAEPYYDLTAWALPYSFNVETYYTADARTVPMQLLVREAFLKKQLANKVLVSRAQYGYLFAYESNSAAKLLARLLQTGYVAMITQTPLQVAGREFGRGAVLVRVERNRAALHDDIGQWSTQFGVEVLALNSAVTENELRLGSPKLKALRTPQIAVMTGPPVNTPEYGAIWHMLEREYEITFTALQMQELRDADLRRYNVIVFPDDEERWAQPRGFYRENLRETGALKLRRWIEEGGAFVGIKGGALLALNDSVSLRSIRLCATRLLGRMDNTPGTIFQIHAPGKHFLTIGLDAPLSVLARNSLLFSPAAHSETVFAFAHKLSGVSSLQDEQRSKGTPYVLVEKVGRGQVVLFADDPTFRLAWQGLARVFLNTLLLGPSSLNQ